MSEDLWARVEARFQKLQIIYAPTRAVTDTVTAGLVKDGINALRKANPSAA